MCLYCWDFLCNITVFEASLLVIIKTDIWLNDIQNLASSIISDDFKSKLIQSKQYKHK